MQSNELQPKPPTTSNAEAKAPDPLAGCSATVVLVTLMALATGIYFGIQCRRDTAIRNDLYERVCTIVGWKVKDIWIKDGEGYNVPAVEAFTLRSYADIDGQPRLTVPSEAVWPYQPPDTHDTVVAKAYRWLAIHAPNGTSGKCYPHYSDARNVEYTDYVAMTDQDCAYQTYFLLSAGGAVVLHVLVVCVWSRCCSKRGRRAHGDGQRSHGDSQRSAATVPMGSTALMPKAVARSDDVELTL